MATAAILISALSALVITLPSSVFSQTCNAAAFTCPSTTSFEDCLDGTTPSAPTNTCPIGTFCDASCSSPCLETVPCSDKMCNSEAFYCTGDNPYDFLTCTADSSVPYPDVQTCMPDTVCSMFCPLPCWEKPCPECKENGRFPVPGNESNYYVCIVVQGGPPIYEEYACPAGALFDAAMAKCVPTGQAQTTVASTVVTTPTTTTPTTTATTPTTTATTPTTTATTPTTTATTPTTTATTPTTTATTPTTTATTPTTTATTPTTTATTPTTTMATSTTTSGVPTCTAAGKMVDPANCKNYYICSALTGGGFLLSPYTCPGDSNFDPVTLKCSLLTTCIAPTTTTIATSTTTTAAVTTSTTPTTTTTTPAFVCPAATGKFVDPTNCAKYYMCSASVAYSYACPGGSLFDPATGKCSLIYVCPV